MMMNPTQHSSSGFWGIQWYTQFSIKAMWRHLAEITDRSQVSLTHHGFSRPWAECIPSAPPDTGAAQAAQALSSQLIVSGQRRYGCIDLSFEDQWLL